MRAKFKGIKKSMKYKPNEEYILALTYHNTYIWAVDINGKGKPVPYSGMDTFLDNWEVIRPSKGGLEEELYKLQEWTVRVDEMD